ncbi:hypothetical protein ACFSHT_03330 [Paraburkholderia silviterrae]|nr:hypothetical protein [Paraburkholderia silviterrae]
MRENVEPAIAAVSTLMLVGTCAAIAVSLARWRTALITAALEKQPT